MKDIVTEIFRTGFAVTGEKARQNINTKWMNALSQKLTITHVIVILALLTTLIQVATAQDGFAKIAATGAPISGVQRETAKANQSQVVWYQGNWWGIFKDSGDSFWYVYKYNNNSWTRGASTGISGSAEADAFVDEVEGKLYVLISSAGRVSRLSYTSGAWVRDSGFPVSVGSLSASGDPACITQAFDGDLFIFYVSSSTLRGLHSTNYGVSWTDPFDIASASSALADAIAFRYEGEDYIGLFVGEGSGGHQFTFRLLYDRDDPTNSSNWVQETLPIASNSDDHVNITKDANDNLYMIGKWGDSNKFRLYKRTNNGNWNYYNIEPSYGTRPSLSIDESNNNLIIFGTVNTGSGSNKIQFTVMDKNNLHDVGNNDWIVALENGSDVFNDATVSYQIVDDVSNLMVCASNTSDGKVWYNLLDVNDITLPVFLASFQATPGAGQINLEWSTYSEVDNWEWILYRRIEGEDQFRELMRLPGSGTTNTTTSYNFVDTEVEEGIMYAYRLANVDFNGQVNYYPEILRSSLSPLVTFKLYNNYPNPFNSETTISFEVGETAHTELKIYDASGQLVKRLFEGNLSPGSYVYKWNGRDDYEQDVASGMYFLSVTSGTFRQSLRMVLSR